ncbi:MAG: caspase family protein [Candidatus Heimdallarchaeota archaeon]|nr:caspase family protein [Candidatus Heimdallarchaeota archaeon]
MKKKTIFGLIFASMFIGSMLLIANSVYAGDSVVNKYAVIVGISDYEAISDLSYCDEDANDWYNQLDANGYTCKVLGDHTNSYLQYDGLATEDNVRQALAYYLSIADDDDIVVFATSGHGGATRGRVRDSFLCMWDCSSGENGYDGYIYDDELKAMYDGAVCKWFIFLDHCNSGGMNGVMSNANSANGYIAATCTAKGYGYDYPPGLNGAWTYFFLEIAWQEHFGGSMSVSMEEIFDYAVSIYPYDRKDLPQEFDGNVAVAFYL